MTTFFFVGIILCLLALSGYFSAAETSMTAASKAKIHHLAKQGNKNAVLVKKIQGNIGRAISALLIGNTMLNSLAVSLATGLFIDLLGTEGMLGEIYASLIMGTIIVLYVEVLPKIFAVNHPERVVIGSARVLNAFLRSFEPLTAIVNAIARTTLKAFGVQSASDASHSQATLDELRGVIELYYGHGNTNESAMLKSILDLSLVSLEDIMTHRTDVLMLNADDPISKITEQAIACQFTRIPIWKNHPDNIIGIINTKNLIRATHKHQQDILHIANKPWFVLDSTNLLQQLHMFRQRCEHFAVVVDEYGSFLGIVTLEDILEEIVGEIVDEHDVIDNEIIAESEGSYLVEGHMTIRDLNRNLNWELPDDMAATVAGLLLYEERVIPEVGQIFFVHNIKFEILRKTKNKITLLRLTPLEAHQESDDT